MDPFTTALMAIWTLLETSDKFKDQVKDRNRIKLNIGSDKPEATEFTIADFPRVIILPYGNINVNMSKSSSDASFVQRYRIVMYDGDKRPTKFYLPLKWTIFCVLAKTDADLGLDYVKNITFSDMSDDPGEEDIFPGWRAMFDVDVEMWFGRTYMKSNI